MKDIKRTRFWAYMACTVAILAGCSGDRPTTDPQQLTITQFSAGNQHLKVTATGTLDDASVMLHLEYRGGSAPLVSSTLDFGTWNISGNTSVGAANFLISVPVDFQRYIVHQIEHTDLSTTNIDVDRLNHFVSRIVSSSLSLPTLSVEEDGGGGGCEMECYCNYCSAHHCPKCRSESEEL